MPSASSRSFCIAVLAKATKLLEPDDSAYLASIIALTHGHITLSTAQYDALSAQLRAHDGTGIMQWVQLANGRWMSEKNPGYPFFAAPFQMLGILRAAPLFVGALASTSLFVAGRRWLGNWGGTWAVILFVSSGAAIAFAWRPTMPSFTDAALIAAGAGALLWTFLAHDAPARRRTVVGLLGFLCLEAAVFVRYTDVVMLLVAAVAVPLAFRKARIPARSLAWWFGSIALVAGGVMLFDKSFYGGALKTGYGAGEITFGLGAVIPNLKLMPPYLVKSIPALLLGFAALAWMAVRVIRDRSTTADPRTTAKFRRDAVVGLVLADRMVRALGALLGIQLDRPGRISRWWRERWRNPPHPFLSPGNRPHRPARCLAAHTTAQVAPPCGAGRRRHLGVLLFPEPHGSWADGVSGRRWIPGWVARPGKGCGVPAAERCFQAPKGVSGRRREGRPHPATSDSSVLAW